MKKLFLLFALLPSLCFASAPSIPPPNNPGIYYGSVLSPMSGGSGASAQQLIGIRKCLMNVQSQTANCLIATVGDSVLGGVNSATTITPQNITYFLAKDLSTIPGIYANDAATCGFGGGGYSRLGLDTRFTSYSGMSLTAASYGGSLAAFGTTSASLVEQPGISTGASPGFVWDTALVTYYGGSGNGTVTATGGTAVTHALNSTGFTSFLVTASSGSASNTLTMTMPTGANAYVSCIIPYLSTQKSINIINSGIPGVTLASMFGDGGINGSYSMGPEFAVIQPNITLAMLGKNDWYYGTTLSTFDTELGQLASLAQTYGQFILTDAIPDSQAISLQATYAPNMQAQAIANGWAFIDLYGRWGTYTAYTALNTAGWYSFTVHPSIFGGADIAYAMYRLLTGY